MFQNLGNSLRGPSDTLKIKCGHCGHTATWSAAMAIRKFGDQAVKYDVSNRLRCSRCDRKKVTVWI